VEADNDIADAGDRCDGSDPVAGYEQLRARALGGQADGWRLGLSVLQQRGLAAWLRVRQATVAAVYPPPSASAATPVAGGVQAELVGLLASMALAVAAPG
jgi:hypothetical protein